MVRNGRLATPRVGFVSTRIAGIDGVSLEIEKWTAILERRGCRCFFIAGESDRPAEQSWIIPEAHFHHPAIQAIDARSFGTQRSSPGLISEILDTSRVLAHLLEEAFAALELDLIIAENCLTIPMNIPLGVALTQVIRESGIHCIAHHHDFFWERERFLINAVGEFIRAAFPPLSPQIEHVVINSLAAEEFSRRTGLSCRIIPNVMDFARPPAPPDEFARELWRALGIADDEMIIIQPTRVVARKGIEVAIELARRLDDLHPVLVITHPAGDEGNGYPQRVREYAELLGVKVRYADRFFAKHRGRTPDGQLLFTLMDAYQQADLVTYPSHYEGFGNALLEAIYARRPICCNRYSIYRTDIEPLGFHPIVTEGYLTAEILAEIRAILDDPNKREEMVAHNYLLARRHFSFEAVEEELCSLVWRGFAARPPAGLGGAGLSFAG